MGLGANVLANLISASIGAILLFMWQRLLFPLVVENFVEATKLAPEYQGSLDFGRGPNHRISLRLKKRGYRVTGMLRFTEGKNQGKEYVVEGRYGHGLLTFTYRPVDRVSTSQGTASFQRLKDGALFKGQFAYYSQEADSVSSVASELVPA